MISIMCSCSSVPQNKLHVTEGIERVCLFKHQKICHFKWPHSVALFKIYKCCLMVELKLTQTSQHCCKWQNTLGSALQRLKNARVLCLSTGSDYFRFSDFSEPAKNSWQPQAMAVAELLPLKTMPVIMVYGHHIRQSRADGSNKKARQV